MDRLRKIAALPGRTGDDRFTGEEAALRRVATLVARGAAPEQVFAAVAEEAARVDHIDASGPIADAIRESGYRAGRTLLDAALG